MSFHVKIWASSLKIDQVMAVVTKEDTVMVGVCVGGGRCLSDYIDQLS